LTQERAELAASSAAGQEKRATYSAPQHSHPPKVPEEPTDLASNWDSLPDHVRTAIVSLALA